MGVPTDNKTPSILKNLRTYESDVADVLAHRNISQVSMAIAENVKRGEGERISNSPPVNPPSGAHLTISPPAEMLVQSEQTEKSHIGRAAFIILLSLVLLAIGAAGGYYLYAKSSLGTKPPAIVVPKTVPALIRYESQSIISTDRLNRSGLIAKIRSELAKTMTPESIKEIVLTENKDSQIYRVSVPEAVSIMSMPVPDILLRTLTPDWMLGIYNNKDNDKYPFVIVKTNLFQNAFAGMFAWEQSMPSDIKDIIFVSDGKTLIPTPTGRFVDQIIKNKDVRAFVKDDGDTVFVYSLIDNSNIIIASNNETLTTVISRLENKAFVR